MVDATFTHLECGQLGALSQLLRPITVVEVPMELVLSFDGIFQ